MHLLTLAPVPTPPVSVRESESQASEHGTTVRVNIPSVESERKEALHDEAGSTDTPHVSLLIQLGQVRRILKKLFKNDFKNYP